MQKAIKTICYDEKLHIEACCFQGIAQPFPNHFHDYYVIGFIKSGTRHLECKNKTYIISKGHILLFNPQDNHGCHQSSQESFTYCALNISKETMLALMKEITGDDQLPQFQMNVIDDKDLYDELSSLHQIIMENSHDMKKEEMFIFFISHLLERYNQTFLAPTPDCQNEIKQICQFIEEHMQESITLKQLCQYSHFSQSTLLRAFTQTTGVTPYRYLQTVRINKAKKLLEQGYSPLEVSLQTGFSDQSHFSHFFNMFTGLSPAVYKRIFKDKQHDR